MRLASMILGYLGSLIFGLAFAWSWLSPTTLEAGARDLLRSEVTRRVEARLDTLAESRAARWASRAGLAAPDDLRDRVGQALPAALDGVFARMADRDCTCRGTPAREPSLADWRSIDAATLRTHLAELARGQYLAAASALLREFRIFMGTNALVLLAFGVAASMRRHPPRVLLLPAGVLVVAAVGVAIVYLFGQDWLRTIVFGQYVGLGYVAWLGIAFAFLADVMLNEARVTRHVSGSIGIDVGSCVC